MEQGLGNVDWKPQSEFESPKEAVVSGSTFIPVQRIVAQFGSARALGAWGRRFESCQSDSHGNIASHGSHPGGRMPGQYDRQRQPAESTHP